MKKDTRKRLHLMAYNIQEMDKTIEEKENMCATVRNNEWKEKE